MDNRLKKRDILIKRDKCLKQNKVAGVLRQIDELLKIETKDMSTYLIDCNFLINNNRIKEAKQLLEVIINLNNGKFNNKITYLKNKIAKIDFENNMTPQERREYIINKEAGDYFSDNGNHLEALFYYKRGLTLTGHNDFNYYIGKTFCKLRINDEAIKYLNEYNLNGSDKFIKSTLYLCIMNNAEIKEKKKNSNNQKKIIEMNNKVRKTNNELLFFCEEVSVLGDFEFKLGNLITFRKQDREINSGKQGYKRKIRRERFNK